MNERGRFAPSPTGELHLGNARTALLSWLWARKGGGGYAIRIEDIDTPRVRPGMAEQQLAELAWLGLDWDGPPVFQSQRTGLYEDALQKLGDHVYECFCSRADTQVRGGQHLLPSAARHILLPRVLAPRSPGGAPAPRVIAESGERL